MSMRLVQTVTVGSSGTTAIEFANIPQSGRDLLVVYSLRGNAAAINQEFPLYFNLNGADYTFRRLSGTGSQVNSDNAASAVGMQASAANATSNTFSNGKVYIPNYTNNTNKSYSVDVVTENNATNAIQAIIAGLWSNTAAITNVSIQGSTIQQHSTASLYIIG